LAKSATAASSAAQYCTENSSSLQGVGGQVGVRLRYAQMMVRLGEYARAD
jgi:hypothetical protein